MLFIAYCESANYCGYGQHFVISAETEQEAEELLNDPAEEYFREQDESHLLEEGVDVEECIFSNMLSIEEFDESHDSWKYYVDPTQESFYIKVNF